MSVLLWYNKGDNDAINLGSLLHVFPAFAEVSELIDGEKGYEELESVPGFAEQEVTEWWLKQVAIQGKKFLDAHGSEMGELVWVVEDLVEEIEKLYRSH
jgi:hypothetical protein